MTLNKELGKPLGIRIKQLKSLSKINLDIFFSFGCSEQDIVVTSEPLTVEKAEQDDLQPEELGDVGEHLEAEVQNLFLASGTLHLGHHGVGCVQPHLPSLSNKRRRFSPIATHPSAIFKGSMGSRTVA